jgi:hypothetical protein
MFKLADALDDNPIFGKNDHKTICVIIDECNIRYAALKLLGGPVDLQLLLCRKVLSRDRHLDGLPRMVMDEREDVLSYQQAYVKDFDIQKVGGYRCGTTYKSRTDPYVGRAVYEAGDSDVDVVVLFSGDGDFEPALSYLKEYKGKEVEVCAVRGSLASCLFGVADRVTFIEEKDCLWRVS